MGRDGLTNASEPRSRASAIDVDLAVVDERVDVVVGGDTLPVTEQLRDLGERACSRVVQRPATTT